MPISSNDFQKSGREASILVVEFLSANYRNAYTLGELVDVMASMGKDLTKQDMESLLSALEYGGKVKSRTIDGETYYRHSQVAGLKLI